MLRLSKLTDYATSIMTSLAQEPDSVRNAVELSAMTHVSPPTVSKVLKHLTRHDLVVSSRGAHGGYRLAKAPEAISMAEVISALEGPIALTECSHSASRCMIESQCGVRANWQKINSAVRTALQEISLAEMAMPLPPAKSRPGKSTSRISAG